MNTNLNIDLIIPLFNKKKHISRAINSALNQRKKFSKIFIINDGSTDGVEEILQNYNLKFKNIEIVNQDNQGVSIARNVGIKQSSADYLVFLDADDELSKFYLHEIYRLIRLNETKNIKIFSTCHKNIETDKFNKTKHYTENKLNLKCSTNPLLDFSLNKTILCSSGLCIKKDLIVNNLFPKTIKVGEDIYIWEKILLKEHLAWSTQELIYIYKNAENRAQIINNDIPYYILAHKDLAILANTFIKKLSLFLFHFISLFIIINQLKIKNQLDDKNFKIISCNQNQLFSIISNIFNTFLSLIIYKNFLFIKKTLNEIELFPAISYLLITPTAPLIFLVFFFNDQKIESTIFLLFSAFISLFIFLISFQSRIYLNFSLSKFYLNIIICYRIIASAFILLILSCGYYLFIGNENFYLFLFALNSLILFWIYEIILLRFEKFNNKVAIKRFLFLIFVYYLLIFLISNNIKYCFLISLIYIFLIILYSLKNFIPLKKKFIKKIFTTIYKYHAIYFFVAGIFFASSNFMFRVFMVKNINFEIASYYFLIFSISTLPSTLYYNVIGQYSLRSNFIRNIYFIFICFFLFITFFIVNLYFLNIIPKIFILLISTFVGSLLLLTGHFFRSKEISKIKNVEKILLKDFLFYLTCGISPIIMFLKIDYINYLILINGFAALLIYFKKPLKK